MLATKRLERETLLVDDMHDKPPPMAPGQKEPPSDALRRSFVIGRGDMTKWLPLRDAPLHGAEREASGRGFPITCAVVHANCGQLIIGTCRLTLVERPARATSGHLVGPEHRLPCILKHIVRLPREESEVCNCRLYSTDISVQLAAFEQPGLGTGEQRPQGME